MVERKFEEFETNDGKWQIKFDFEDERGRGGSERRVSINLILNEEERNYLTKKDIEKLKQDLKDLGKFRIIKQGKEFLGE